jgi:hypothetical protein
MVNSYISTTLDITIDALRLPLLRDRCAQCRLLRRLAMTIFILAAGCGLTLHEFGDVIVIVEHEAADLCGFECAIDAHVLQSAPGDAKHFSYFPGFKPFLLFVVCCGLKELTEFGKEFCFEFLQIFLCNDVYCHCTSFVVNDGCKVESTGA